MFIQDNYLKIFHIYVTAATFLAKFVIVTNCITEYKSFNDFTEVDISQVVNSTFTSDFKDVCPIYFIVFWSKHSLIKIKKNFWDENLLKLM